MWWELQVYLISKPHVHCTAHIVSIHVQRAWSFVPRCMASFLTLRVCICQSSLEEVRLWPHFLNRVVSTFVDFYSSDFPIKFHLSKVFQSKIKTKSNWNRQTSLLTLRSGKLSSISSYKNPVQFFLSHQLSVSERLLQCEEGASLPGICCPPAVLFRAQHNFPVERGNSGNITLRLSRYDSQPLADPWATMSQCLKAQALDSDISTLNPDFYWWSAFVCDLVPLSTKPKYPQW